MPFGSALAIYALIWVLCLFVVLPFGVRTDEEAGLERQPGHADSAPHRFSLSLALFRAAIVAAVVFGLYYANFVHGWVSVDVLTWARPPAG